MSTHKSASGDNALALAVLNSVQNPVILVDPAGHVAFANLEA